MKLYKPRTSTCKWDFTVFTAIDSASVTKVCFWDFLAPFCWNLLVYFYLITHMLWVIMIAMLLSSPFHSTVQEDQPKCKIHYANALRVSKIWFLPECACSKGSELPFRPTSSTGSTAKEPPPPGEQKDCSISIRAHLITDAHINKWARLITDRFSV